MTFNDFANNLVPLGAGLSIIFLTVRLTIWVIRQMQEIQTTNNELSKETLAAYRADLEEQRAHVERLEDRVQRQNEQLLSLRLERVELVARNRELENRVRALEARLGIAPPVAVDHDTEEKPHE